MIKEFYKRTATAILLVAIVVGAYLHSQNLFIALLMLVLYRIVTDEMPRLYKQVGVKFFLQCFMYPILPMLGLVFLTVRFYRVDYFLPCYLLLIASVADTAAYIVGSLIGKRKIWPSLSPKKTWEGFFGAFLAVLVVNRYWFSLLNTSVFKYLLESPMAFIVFGFFITEAAFLGGMYFSWLKRRQSLKDAGSLLPGHGGFLDRFDSIFGVVVVVAAYLFLVNF